MASGATPQTHNRSLLGIGKHLLHTYNLAPRVTKKSKHSYQEDLASFASSSLQETVQSGHKYILNVLHFLPPSAPKNIPEENILKEKITTKLHLLNKEIQEIRSLSPDQTQNTLHTVSRAHKIKKEIISMITDLHKKVRSKIRDPESLALKAIDELKQEPIEERKKFISSLPSQNIPERGNSAPLNPKQLTELLRLSVEIDDIDLFMGILDRGGKFDFDILTHVASQTPDCPKVIQRISDLYEGKSSITHALRLPRLDHKDQLHLASRICSYTRKPFCSSLLDTLIRMKPEFSKQEKLTLLRAGIMNKSTHIVEALTPQHCHPCDLYNPPTIVSKDTLHLSHPMETSLSFAMRVKSSVEIIQLLIERAGEDAEWLVNQPAYTLIQDPYNPTPTKQQILSLIYPLQKATSDIARILIESGANPLIPNLSDSNRSSTGSSCTLLLSDNAQSLSSRKLSPQSPTPITEQRDWLRISSELIQNHQIQPIYYNGIAAPKPITREEWLETCTSQIKKEGKTEEAIKAEVAAVKQLREHLLETEKHNAFLFRDLLLTNQFEIASQILPHISPRAVCLSEDIDGNQTVESLLVIAIEKKQVEIAERLISKAFANGVGKLVINMPSCDMVATYGDKGDVVSAKTPLQAARKYCPRLLSTLIGFGVDTALDDLGKAPKKPK